MRAFKYHSFISFPIHIVHFFVISTLISITIFKASNSWLSIATRMYCCSFVLIPRFYEYSRKAKCITELAALSLSQRIGMLRVRYSNEILKIHPTALSLQFFFKSADYGHSVEITRKIINITMWTTDYHRHVLFSFLFSQTRYIIDF